jgi:hypothetical protein
VNRGVDDISIRVDPIGIHFQKLRFDHFEPVSQVVVSRRAALREDGAGAGRQLVIQPSLHAVAAHIHDAIHAEVEVGVFKLKKLAEERPEFFERRRHR